MKQYADDFSVERMACILEVSRSGYYSFAQGTLSAREQENARLFEKIRFIHEASHEIYGSPRIHAELKAQGETCSRKRVARLMRQHGLCSRVTKRFKKTTQQSDKPFYVGADLVQQQFKRHHPDEVWVSDITYISTLSGWVYCAVVLDLYSRRVIGLSVDDHMRADLVISALRQALIHRRPAKGLVHHSDKGSQYTSFALKKMADAYGLRLSTGRVGNAYDNAVAESFFHTLKTEHVYFKQYKNLEEAKMDIFQYIYGFYNQQRRHSTLGYVSPAQFENLSCISKKRTLLAVH